MASAFATKKKKSRNPKTFITLANQNKTRELSSSRVETAHGSAADRAKRPISTSMYNPQPHRNHRDLNAHGFA